MSLIRNKKYGLKYEQIDKYEAGIELLGTEVKSIKEGHGVLDASYVILRGGEAYLINADIPPYQPKNAPKDYDPTRPRRVLLTKKEILKLSNTTNQKGLTIVPLSMYNKENKIKIEIAVSRGKKEFDKRETIKKRESKKNIERIIKYSR